MPLHVVSYISHGASALLRVIQGMSYSDIITHNKMVVDKIIFRSAAVYCMLEQTMHSRH